VDGRDNKPGHDDRESSTMAFGIIGHPQANGQKRGGAEREADPGDAGRPSDPVEDLAEDRGADETAGEVAGKIDAACQAAVGSGGTAHEAGRDRLGEERSDPRRCRKR
jgi:hypothetical protein